MLVKNENEPVAFSRAQYAHALDLALKKARSKAQTAKPNNLFSYLHTTKSMSVTDGSVICLSISSR